VSVRDKLVERNCLRALLLEAASREQAPPLHR